MTRPSKNLPRGGLVSLCRSFTTLSVACLVKDKYHCCKENKEELKVNCPLSQTVVLFCKFLPVVGVLEDDCRVFSEPCRLHCRFYPLEGLNRLGCLTIMKTIAFWKQLIAKPCEKYNFTIIALFFKVKFKVEFVVGSLPDPRGFSPGTPVKTNISKFLFGQDAVPPWKPLWTLVSGASWVNIMIYLNKGDYICGNEGKGQGWWGCEGNVF